VIGCLVAALFDGGNDGVEFTLADVSVAIGVKPIELLAKRRRRFVGREPAVAIAVVAGE
jgi:hypothetical protein